MVNDMKMKEKNLAKLADKVGFHLYISSTMKKMRTCISFKSSTCKRKLCLCLFIVLFSVVTTFLPKVFGILTPNFTTKSEKYD